MNCLGQCWMRSCTWWHCLWLSTMGMGRRGLSVLTCLGTCRKAKQWKGEASYTASAFSRSHHGKTTAPSYFLSHKESLKQLTGEGRLLIPHWSHQNPWPRTMPDRIWLRQTHRPPRRVEIRRQTQKHHESETAWRLPCPMGCFQHAHQ